MHVGFVGEDGKEGTACGRAKTAAGVGTMVAGAATACRVEDGAGFLGLVLLGSSSRVGQGGSGVISSSSVSFPRGITGPCCCVAWSYALSLPSMSLEARVAVMLFVSRREDEVVDEVLLLSVGDLVGTSSSSTLLSSCFDWVGITPIASSSSAEPLAAYQLNPRVRGAVLPQER